MAKTDEGKVKDKVKTVLATFSPLRAWWPVPSGYGESTVDCHVTYQGKSIAIEVKRHGEKPTPLQKKFLRDHAAAGGHSIVIEGAADPKDPPRNLHLLHFILNNLANYDGAATEVHW